MFAIDHNTTVESLNRRTAPELREALAKYYPNLKFAQYKKSELIEQAMVVASNELARHNKEQEAAEQRRQERIAFEKTLPNTAKALKMIAEACEAEVESAKATHAKFIARATDDPADAIRRMAEDAFVSSQTIREFGSWAQFFNEQAENPTHTIFQMQEVLEKAAKQHTDRALNCSMYPTNAIQSLEQVARYKVDAKLAKVFGRAAKNYKEVAETTSSSLDNASAFFELSHLRFCL